MVQENFNTAFFGIFLIEMIIKLIGFGFKQYFVDSYNSFDAFIVLVSVIDICISNLAGSEI
jgi:hypothetical protein